MNQEVSMVTLCIRAFGFYSEENGRPLESFEKRHELIISFKNITLIALMRIDCRGKGRVGNHLGASAIIQV